MIEGRKRGERGERKEREGKRGGRGVGGRRRGERKRDID